MSKDSVVKNENDQGGKEARNQVNDEDKKVVHLSICDGVNRVRQDIWHGMTSDGTMVALEEDIV